MKRIIGIEIMKRNNRKKERKYQHQYIERKIAKKKKIISKENEEMKENEM